VKFAGFEVVTAVCPRIPAFGMLRRVVAAGVAHARRPGSSSRDTG